MQQNQPGPPRPLRFKPKERPYGNPNNGRAVSIYTNAFVINRLPTIKFYHYDVVFDPPAGNPRRAQEIIDRLQMRTQPSLFRPRAAFDGKKNLYSSHQIAQGGVVEFLVNMSDLPPQPNSRGIIRVQLKQVAEIEPILGRLNNLIEGADTDDPAASPWQPAVNLLQVLVRQAPLMKGNTYNRHSVFDANVKQTMPGGFELWRGYFQSVRPTIEHMVINVDISTAVVYRHTSIIDWCIDFLTPLRGRGPAIDVRYLESLTPRDQHWRVLRQALNKVRVIATVPADKQRARRIKDLVANAGAFEFNKDGQITTVRDYYRAQHNKALEHPRLFGLLIDCKGTVIIPAEVCKIEAGQIYKKTMSPEMTSRIVEFATKRPDQRMSEIVGAVRGTFLNYSQSDFVSGVNMNINTAPLQVQGRILTPPAIQFKLERPTDKPIHLTQPGSWKIRPQKFAQVGPQSRWGVLNLSRQPLESVSQFVHDLKKTCEDLGMSVADLHGSIKMGSSQGGVAKVLEEIVRDVKPTLIIIVLPDQTHTLPQRRIVKVWGDTVGKVSTQCVMEGKIRNRRANDSYCVNVALKINPRLGGVNTIARSDLYDTKLRGFPTMVVGADVGHPGPGVKDRPSITSVVASYENTFTRYAAFSRVQHPRQEIIEHLSSMMVDALEFFHRRNPVLLPDPKNPKSPYMRNLFFYRDGVSEGEYVKVFETEVQAIHDAWAEFHRQRNWPRPPLNLVFIIVGKRHHIRFFPDRGARNDVKDNSGNVHAGLVVDRGIANPAVLDFYLQSHSGLLGTSRPSHYIVLCAPSFISVDDLQELSFYLCHVYARASRSVSIPAPVYYADLVCDRANYYFADELNNSDIVSATSGPDPPFDILRWENGYHPPGPEMMYFV